MRARLLIVVVAALAIGAAPASAETDAFAVHYEGNYEWHQDWEGSGTSAGSYLRTNETLAWVMDVSGSKAGPGLATDLHVKLAATGTIDVQDSDPNGNEHCTMVQAEGGAAGSGDARVDRNSDGTLNLAVGLPSSVGGDLTVTGNHQNCDEFAGTSVLFCTPTSCAGATVCGAVPPVFHEQSFSAAIMPSLEEAKDASKPFDVGGPRATDTVSCPYGGTETTRVGVTSSVRLNAGGAAVHEPPKGRHNPTIERQKVFAKGDLLPTIFRAETACGVVAFGTTALIWGTTVPGVGGAAAIAGDLLLLGSGPACITLVDRIYDDVRIIDDPPRHDFTKVARPHAVHTPVPLPACSKEPAAPAGFCAGVRADDLAYVAALRRATAVDDALLTTVDRESGAVRAGAGGALKLQEHAGTRLVSELRAASRAARAAGAALAKELGTEGVGGSLSAAQLSGGIARISGALRKRGVTPAMLPESDFAPGPIDLIAGFGH